MPNNTALQLHVLHLSLAEDVMLLGHKSDPPISTFSISPFLYKSQLVGQKDVLFFANGTHPTKVTQG
jgi:hypothetical protein